MCFVIFVKKQNITFYRENKTQNRVRDAKTSFIFIYLANEFYS